MIKVVFENNNVSFFTYQIDKDPLKIITEIARVW